MTPGTRVALASAVVVGAVLLVVTASSERWFHARSDLARYLDEDERTEWDGFGGPSDDVIGLTPGDVLSIVAGLSTLLAPLCGLLAAFGTIAGRRRDHVPRLPALLAWLFAVTAVLFQAISILTWPISEQQQPRGFGWAMPAFFVAGVAFTTTAFILWRDASRRARASADALAKVNRELAAKDLVTMPELAAEEPPVERV